MGPYIWDDFFSYFIGVCLLERGRLNFTVHSRVRSSDCAAVYFGPQVNNSRTMPMFGPLSTEWTKQRRLHQKQNHLQPSAHIMLRHVISAHSSKATPPSTDDSSNITSHHPSPWKAGSSEWRVKWSKWNHPWLSEHLQNNGPSAPKRTDSPLKLQAQVQVSPRVKTLDGVAFWQTSKIIWSWFICFSGFITYSDSCFAFVPNV